MTRPQGSFPTLSRLVSDSFLARSRLVPGSLRCQPMSDWAGCRFRGRVMCRPSPRQRRQGGRGRGRAGMSDSHLAAARRPRPARRAARCPPLFVPSGTRQRVGVARAETRGGSSAGHDTLRTRYRGHGTRRTRYRGHVTRPADTIPRTRHSADTWTALDGTGARLEAATRRAVGALGRLSISGRLDALRVNRLSGASSIGKMTEAI